MGNGVSILDFFRDNISVILIILLIFNVIHLFALVQKFRVRQKTLLELSKKNDLLISAKEENESQLHDIKLLNDKFVETNAEKEAQLEEIRSLTQTQKVQLEEIHQLNRELSDKQADLENAILASKNQDQNRSQFLINISHDVRTPMNSIAGFTSLLEAHMDDPLLVAEYVGKIKESTNDLLLYINDVLEIAQIDGGKITLEEKAFSVMDMHNSIMEHFTPEFDAKDITFSTNVEVDDPYVICDANKIREIMFNILENACKYTFNGGTVSLTLTQMPHEEEGYVYLQTVIQDNGMGIPADVIPRLFDEFTRERSSTESRISGAGLGMPIVKSLIELMNGTIRVESEEYVGTTVYVKLPHKLAQKEDIASLGDAIEEAVEKEFRGKRILLAEDNELNAEIAAAILEDAGFSVEWAKDGIECIDYLDRATEFYFDIVLMDIEMPNMDGYRATRTIRQMDDPDKKVIPILAMTANALEEDRKKSIEAGMNGHLTKPINVPELLDAIRKEIN